MKQTGPKAMPVFFFYLEDRAICFPEISVDFQRSARRHIPEDRTLHNIQNVPGGKVNILGEGVIVSAILSKKVYMYMCPIPNGF
jgi:hypothetical protein